MPLFNNIGSAQDLVFIEDIQSNTLIVPGGGLRQVLMVGGLNFALKSEEEQNAIAESYQNFLNALDFPLQIIVHSRKINIEKYLSSLETRKEEESSALLQSQIAEYQEFIRNFVQEYAVMKKIFLVIIPFSPIKLPSKAAMRSIFSFGKKKTTVQQAQEIQDQEATFRESLAQLNQRTAQVVDGFKTIGLEVTILNDEQLVELFYNFYNPETVEKRSIALSANQDKTGENNSQSKQNHE